MKVIEHVQATRENVIAMICDVCHIRYNDIMEMQEFLHINFRGGFNSIFGDGNQVKADICQHCIKEKFGNSLRIE